MKKFADKESLPLSDAEKKLAVEGIYAGKVSGMDFSYKSLIDLEKYLCAPDPRRTTLDEISSKAHDVFGHDEPPKWWRPGYGKMEFVSCNFTGTVLPHMNGVEFIRCKFDSLYIENTLYNVAFRNCALDKVVVWAPLHIGRFFNCDLSGTSFSCLFDDCYFYQCDFTDASFDKCCTMSLATSTILASRFYNTNINYLPVDMVNGSSNDGLMAIHDIGSRRGTTIATRHSDGVMVKCGCFYGSMDNFIEAVKKTHKGDDSHRGVYLEAVKFIKTYAKLYWDTHKFDFVRSSSVTEVFNG